MTQSLNAVDPFGDLLIATLCHGAINLSQGLLLGGLTGSARYWLLAVVYGIAAMAIGSVLRGQTTISVSAARSAGGR